VAAELMRRHGAEVMASAQHWAETPEDAEDAYQRGMEIMLKKAPSTDPEHLVPWLKTVVKREAVGDRRSASATRAVGRARRARTRRVP
jgi:DNA-directed RNA polymerase specialized sigma24 family protein